MLTLELVESLSLDPPSMQVRLRNLLVIMWRKPVAPLDTQSARSVVSYAMTQSDRFHGAGGIWYETEDVEHAQIPITRMVPR